MDQHLQQMVVTIFCTILASSGFWAFIQHKLEKKSISSRLLIGIGHDRIMYLANQYLSRGDWITTDEYENLRQYLYEPYIEAGGNGACKRIMQEVDNRLRIVSSPPHQTF